MSQLLQYDPSPLRRRAVKQTENYVLHGVHLESPSAYPIDNTCSQQTHKPTTNSVMKRLGFISYHTIVHARTWSLSLSTIK
jgi:hypothetical protein